jgi:hypothetical protein
MQNKKTYTDFIISELNKGNVQYKDVCSVFLRKFALSRQTFDKYWKTANEDYKQQREAINNAKLSTSIELEKEAVKDANFYRNKILAKMEEIMEQKAKKVEGQIIMPTYSDVIRAGERIAKIMGVDAPTKSENINTNLNQEFKGFNFLPDDPDDAKAE